ncbi:MAG TPA: Crp/Fnr family transcriptional regulator [Dissulfurispiraceae bacterium]|nr:Crp/Fnr family transcriptional regulator [Dissulfurispiraceae bacterium]
MASIEYLKKIGLFASLSDEEIGEMVSSIERGKFRKKEAIFSEGDPSNWFYILVSGKVKITKLSHDGKEIIIELISPGDFFGGFAVLRGFPYPANAVAMEDCDTVRISRHNLLSIIERFPSFMYDITANLGERVREFSDTLKNIALERVESRIASLLLKLAEKTGEKASTGEIEIAMKLTKQDIAEMVGTTVETSIRVMSRFKKSRFLREADGRIVIINLKSLKTLVNPE